MAPENIRSKISMALSDIHYCQKGILEVQLARLSLSSSGRFTKKAMRTVAIDGYEFKTPADIVSCREGKSFKQSSALITELDYQMASWRRAILSLDHKELSWVLYCYGGKLNYQCQEIICLWLWDEFQNGLILHGFKKMKARTRNIMKRLVYTCIQKTRHGILFHFSDEYKEDKELAFHLEMSVDSWRKDYKKRWYLMKKICLKMDIVSLLNTAEKRNEIITSNRRRVSSMPVQASHAPDAS